MMKEKIDAVEERELFPLHNKLLLLLIIIILVLHYFLTPDGYIVFVGDSNIDIPKNDLEETSDTLNNGVRFKNLGVPDIVHYILFDKTEITFLTFISMLSVIKIQKPNKLIIHTNHMHIDGKYFNYFKLVLYNSTFKFKTDFEIHYLKKPTKLLGIPIRSVRQAEELAAFSLLSDFGGIYLADEQVILQPLDRFRYYEMVLGWPDGGEIRSEVLIADKEARFVKLWLTIYQHSRHLLITTLHRHPELVHREKEVLGVNQKYEDLWIESKWTDWKYYYSINLNVDSQFFNKFEVNESSINRCNCPVADIVNNILETEPKFDLNFY